MKRNIPDAARQAAIDTYADGLSLEATAARHGVSKNTVARWARDAGVLRPGRSAGPQDSSPTVYKDGWEVRGGIAYPLAPRRVRP